MPTTIPEWESLTAVLVAAGTILATGWRYLLRPFGRRLTHLWQTIDRVHDISISVGEAIPRIEAEQSRARAGMRLLFSAYGCGVFETDEHGRTLWVSERYCELVQRPAEAILGGNWPLCVHPLDRGSVAQEWAQAVAEQRRVEVRYRVIHPNGHIVAVIGRASPVLREGKLIGYIGELCPDGTRADAG